MRFLHILIILIIVFFTHEFVFAEEGTTSRSAAIKDNIVQTTAGLAGIAGGYFLAKPNCPACSSGNGQACAHCALGISMGVSSLGTLNRSDSNTRPTSNALALGNNGGMCAADPSLCNSSNNSDINFPNPLNEPIIEQFRNFARDQGVDIDNPASVEKFMSDNADALSSGAGDMQLPASVAAKVEQYKKYLDSKYKVSSVATEGGGGGRFPASTKGSKDIDFNALLEGLNKTDKPDGSTEGLSRKLASGEPVGVASDNIFKQISRRYQAKRAQLK